MHSAESAKHGCTLVIDLNEKPLDISGQKLREPLDLRQPQLLELTKSLAKVDGALHVGIDMNLLGFAGLLDGRAIKGEDRSRGARFNSALRFTAEHDNIFVVVVSSDRPVSVIQAGIELSAQCHWNPFSSIISLPPTIEEWVRRQSE
ncbi:DNA integrity scanning protein DisA nucleotide-binding domain protein [Thermodesulfobacteriota bacterium]